MNAKWLRLILACAAVMLGAPQQSALAQGDKPIAIDVGLGDVSLTKLIFIIAGESGIYARNGLKISQFITPNAAKTIRANGVVVPDEFVREGEGDINIGGGSPMIVARATRDKASDRVILATQDATSRFQVIVREGIGKPEDLKGMKLGYSSPGALSHYSAIMFAKKMGWDPAKEVTLVRDSMSVEGLKSGRVDAFLGNEVPRSQALKAGYKVVADLDTMKVPMAGSGVNAERAWLANNREGAKRFVKSTVDAIALAKSNKQVVIDALVKWYRITGADEQAVIWDEVAKFPPKPYPAVDGIKATMEVFDSPGMRKLRAEDLYDLSFMTELDKSGYIDGLYRSK